MVQASLNGAVDAMAGTVEVPAGVFVMGSATGRPDEAPPHAVTVRAFRLGRTPVTNAQYALFLEAGRGSTPQWWGNPAFGAPEQPVVGVTWLEACAYARWLTKAAGGSWRLPTEAEWERAARGGLIGKRYSWGDEPPNEARCDFGHFGTFVIRPPRELPPNGYGLFGMCGGVWEWTADPYDALRYHPRRPAPSFEAGAARVLRGGSFVDEEAAVTVSFRMALTSEHWGAPANGGRRRSDQLTPTVGFRLVRRGPPPVSRQAPAGAAADSPAAKGAPNDPVVIDSPAARVTQARPAVPDSPGPELAAAQAPGGDSPAPEHAPADEAPQPARRGWLSRLFRLRR